MFYKNYNGLNRQEWLAKTLARLPKNTRILDAGANELKNRQHCAHLDYVSQDFCQYEGMREGAVNEGLQSKNWDTSRIDLVSDITAIPAPDASFDAIMCCEVLEHVQESTRALDEFSRYWYEYHLPMCGLPHRRTNSNWGLVRLCRAGTHALGQQRTTV